MNTYWLLGTLGMKTEMPEEFLRSVENDHAEIQQI